MMHDVATDVVPVNRGWGRGCDCDDVSDSVHFNLMSEALMVARLVLVIMFWFIPTSFNFAAWIECTCMECDLSNTLKMTLLYG
jgi:hypothetical protein